MTNTENPTKGQSIRAGIFWIGGTLLMGTLSGLLGGSTMSFDTLQKPPLSPPEWVFPVAWGILYVLMGIAAFLVWRTHDEQAPAALRLYVIQLIVNVLWPLIFFRLEWRLFALIWLIALIVLVALTILAFRRVGGIAWWLLLPYLAWCLFACYLNLGFYILNIA